MSSPEILTLAGVSKRFGDLTAVDNVAFGVRRGEIFGLLGPNGAGKTTTINMLCGLLAPDSGEILFDSRPIRGKAGKARIGYCPQDISVWETLTCREQLVFMARMFGVRGRTARQRADGLLEAVGLSEKSRRLARTLSGGMQRRLNIVLALVHEPDLVVLDEPQAGLDPQSRVMVRDYIRSLAGRMTVVLTTHDMEEADKLSTRVAIMDRGRLLALDTPENLKSSSAISRVVEVRPTPATVGGVEPLLSDPGARGLGLTWKDGMLSFGSRSVAGDLQLLMSLLQKAGVAAEDLRVRGRTLEDVFIGLTGKGLRE